MTRLRTIGFESGALSHEVDDVGSGALISTNSGNPRTGTYCCAVGTGYIRIALPSARDEVYIGFGWLFKDIGNGAFFKIKDSDGHDIANLYQHPGGTFSLQIAGVSVDTTVETYGADEWHYFEIYYLDALNGSVTVKINGEIVLTYTGDTRGNGAWTSPLYFVIESEYVDDFVVNDALGTDNNSWTGRVKLIPLRPNGVGDVTQLTRGGTDTGNNFSQVNEVPASSTQYVVSDTPDQYDLYNYGTAVLPAGYEISNVIVVNDAYLDSGEGKVTGMVKSGGVEDQGDDHVLSNSPHAYTDTFPLNPATGLAWTQDEIDAIQAGIKVR